MLDPPQQPHLRHPQRLVGRRPASGGISSASKPTATANGATAPRAPSPTGATTTWTRSGGTWSPQRPSTSRTFWSRQKRVGRSGAAITSGARWKVSNGAVLPFLTFSCHSETLAGELASGVDDVHLEPGEVGQRLPGTVGRGGREQLVTHDHRAGEPAPGRTAAARCRRPGRAPAARTSRPHAPRWPRGTSPGLVADRPDTHRASSSRLSQSGRCRYVVPLLGAPTWSTTGARRAAGQVTLIRPLVIAQRYVGKPARVVADRVPVAHVLAVGGRGGDVQRGLVTARQRAGDPVLRAGHDHVRPGGPRRTCP